MRVVLASERAQVQNLLMDVVEEEPGVVVVGRADNATRAVALAKSLRPDVAIIDSRLPYSVGLDTVALSRISGLDTAQIIAETIPRTRVIVVNNLDRPVLAEHSLIRETRAAFFREGWEGSIALKLGELQQTKVMAPHALVFANVEVQPLSAAGQKSDEVAGGAVLRGTTGILGGGYLIGTLILAPVGVLLALAGVVSLVFGLLKKLTVRLWRQEREGSAG